MNGEKILVIILSILNFAFIVYCLYSAEASLLWIPLTLGIATFLIAKFVKKLSNLKALKYANIAFFIPALIIFIILIFPTKIVDGGRTAGVQDANPDTLCWDTCKSTVQDINNAISDCVTKCLQDLNK